MKGDPAMQLLGQEPLRRGKSIGGWQDSCAVHDLRASDGESAPWRQDARAAHSPTALCGAFRIHATHILPKLAVLEYMKAIYCHEVALFASGGPFGNASGRYLAMASSLGMHQGTILPSRHRMIATEVHRRSISDCNGDGACPHISAGSAHSRMQSLGNLV